VGPVSSDPVLARDAPREPADGFPLGEAAVQRSLDAARKLERVLGPDHPDTLNGRDSLAAAYQAAGRPVEAIRLFEDILVARERVLGPKHPDTLTSQNNLAATYQDVGRFAEAILLFKLTLAARERLFGADHHSTLNSGANLAAAYRAMGQVSEAIPLLEQTVAEPPPAVEQQSAEEQSAEQEPAEEPVPSPMESPAAPSSDAAASEPIAESPVALDDEEKRPAESAEEEPPALQDISQPMLPAEEPPVAVVAAEPPVPSAAEERLAEEPTSTATPLRAGPRWRLRRRAIEHRPEPVSVPKPELQAPQDVSDSTPLAEEPPVAAAEPSAPRAAQEPLATAAVEEAAAEKPPDAPLSEEPPAVAADVEPAAAPADGEEPAATADAETGHQGSPESVPVPGPELEQPAPQCISGPAPPAEDPPVAVVAAEPPVAPAVEERSAEEMPSTAAPLRADPRWRLRKRAIKRCPELVPVPEPEPQDVSDPKPPLAEEAPAVAAEVEPAAASADGEEPAAAAAETGDQASPEPAPVPEREPDRDVSEPAPLANEPPAAASPEEPPAPSTEEPAAEEPLAPSAGEPPAAEEPSAPPAGRWPASATAPAPARDRTVRRRRRVLSLVAAVVIMLAAGGAAGFLTRPQAGPSGHGSAASRGARSQPLSAAAQLAAAWVAQQIAPSTIVACDPLMCSALEAQGVPAANLLVLQADATSPLGAQVVVVTPAVRSQFGSRVDSVYAPSVIAGFGSGPGQVSVQVVAQDGPASYLAASRQDAADRRIAGAQLLANKQILASAQARAQLAAGAVDSRLLIMLPALAAVHPIRVLAFGDPAPGAGPGVPLCSADLSGSGQAANMSDVSYLRWLTSFVGTQLVPFAGSMSVLQEPGQPVVRVVFAQPSPLGLLAHT